MQRMITGGYRRRADECYDRGFWDGTKAKPPGATEMPPHIWKALFELLKAIGAYGHVLPAQETNFDKLFDQQVMTALAREKIPNNDLDRLITSLEQNPLKRQRQAEIEAELRAKYGDE
jgi:hypothetical protein